MISAGGWDSDRIRKIPSSLSCFDNPGEIFVCESCMVLIRLGRQWLDLQWWTSRIYKVVSDVMQKTNDLSAIGDTCCTMADASTWVWVLGGHAEVSRIDTVLL